MPKAETAAARHETRGCIRTFLRAIDPDIVFVPDHVEGTLSTASIHGRFQIHGKDHEMTMVVEAVPAANRLDITTHFIIPYVDWGMKNPSTLFLRVGDKVTIDVRAMGRIQPSPAGGIAGPEATAQTISR